jgi:hypothetical protein
VATKSGDVQIVGLYMDFAPHSLTGLLGYGFVGLFWNFRSGVDRCRHRVLFHLHLSIPFVVSLENARLISWPQTNWPRTMQAYGVIWRQDAGKVSTPADMGFSAVVDVLLTFEFLS